jgi:hypothetical protein
MNFRRALLRRMEKTTSVEMQRASNAIGDAGACTTRREGALGQKKNCG